MKISEVKTRKSFYDKIVDAIENQPDGEGFSKLELAEHFGCSNPSTVESWLRKYPKLSEYRVYIHINEGTTRSAVFVNKQYKQQLLNQGIGTERY